MYAEPKTIQLSKGAGGSTFVMYEKIFIFVCYIADSFNGICSDVKGKESLLFGLFLFNVFE